MTEAELVRREGREYEPAGVLLERVRAGRAATAPVKSPRRRKSTGTITLEAFGTVAGTDASGPTRERHHQAR